MVISLTVCWLYPLSVITTLLIHIIAALLIIHVIIALLLIHVTAALLAFYIVIIRGVARGRAGA